MNENSKVIYLNFLLITILYGCASVYGLQGKKYRKYVESQYKILNTAKTAKSADALVFGYVRETKKHTPLPATVYLTNSLKVRTACDLNGYFELHVPDGNYQIAAQFSSHNPVKFQTFEFRKGTKIEVLIELGKNIEYDQWDYE